MIYLALSVFAFVFLAALVITWGGLAIGLALMLVGAITSKVQTALHWLTG